jgi:hypothetical protein
MEKYIDKAVGAKVFEEAKNPRYDKDKIKILQKYNTLLETFAD